MCIIPFFASGQDDVIAFTVSHGETKGYSPGERFEFETIITNEGGGFLPGQNEFLCPTRGLYMFTLSTCGYAGTNAIAEVWMDDSIIFTALDSSDKFGATSNLAYVHCQAGSRVFVVCSQQACIPYGTADGYVNTVTFSGMLVSGNDEK